MRQGKGLGGVLLRHCALQTVQLSVQVHQLRAEVLAAAVRQLLLVQLREGALTLQRAHGRSHSETELLIA